MATSVGSKNQHIPVFTIYALGQGFVVSTINGDIAVTDEIDLLDALAGFMNQARQSAGLPPIGTPSSAPVVFENTAPQVPQQFGVGPSRTPAEIAAALGLPFQTSQHPTPINVRSFFPTEQPQNVVGSIPEPVQFTSRSGKKVRATFGRDDSDNPPLPAPPFMPDMSDPRIRVQIKNLDIANSKLLDSKGGPSYTAKDWQDDIETHCPDIPSKLAEIRFGEMVAELREDQEGI